MSTTSLHVLSQPLSKTCDNFFDWICGKLFHIFCNATFDSETVLASDKTFKKASCITPQTWHLQGIQIWRVLNHLRDSSRACEFAADPIKKVVQGSRKRLREYVEAGIRHFEFLLQLVLAVSVATQATIKILIDWLIDWLIDGLFFQWLSWRENVSSDHRLTDEWE